MRSYKIVGLPGDGIGPECLDATLQVLDAIQACCDITLEVTRHEAGAEHYRRHGVALPDDVLQDCLNADAGTGVRHPYGDPFP